MERDCVYMCRGAGVTGPLGWTLRDLCVSISFSKVGGVWFVVCWNVALRKWVKTIENSQVRRTKTTRHRFYQPQNVNSTPSAESQPRPILLVV